MSASNGKQIVMFLDYDGTLSPIVDDPDSAFMSDTVSTDLYIHLIINDLWFEFFPISSNK